MNRTVELLRLIDYCNSIVGRKKLQKIVHILKESGHPFPYRYGFHFHGAFSAELKAEIDALLSEELIEEKEDGSLYGGFHQYQYHSTDRAKEFLLGLDTGAPKWAPLAARLNAKPAQELEAISTVLYLRQHGCPEFDLKTRFEQLKPHLADKFESSMRFIREAITRSPSTDSVNVGAKGAND